MPIDLPLLSRGVSKDSAISCIKASLLIQKPLFSANPITGCFAKDERGESNGVSFKYPPPCLGHYAKNEWSPSRRFSPCETLFLIIS